MWIELLRRVIEALHHSRRGQAEQTIRQLRHLIASPQAFGLREPHGRGIPEPYDRCPQHLLLQPAAQAEEAGDTRGLGGALQAQHESATIIRPPNNVHAIREGQTWPRCSCTAVGPLTEQG